MNRKTYGLARAAELAEMQRFEAALGGTQKPFSRLRVWTGEESAKRRLGGVDAANAVRADGRYQVVIDMGRHEWFVRVWMEFSGAPGNYELYYLCDLEGQGFPVGDVSGEAGWTRFGVGRATGVWRLCGGSIGLSGAREDDTPAYHEQPSLFGRWLAVVLDGDESVTRWTVGLDSYVDVTEYLSGEQGPRLSDRGAFGELSRPELSFTVYPDAGMDVDGIFADYRRVTYEVGFRGDFWEQPAGFEGSGYWPRFTGYIRRASVREDVEAGTEVQVIALSGRRELDSVCTVPLVERVPVGEYVRDWLLMDGLTGERLMGVREELGVGIGTVRGEYVGRTREFGGNWFEQLLSVDANQERVYGICWTGEHFVGVVLKEDVESDEDNSVWGLVRWDAAGREIERIALCLRYYSGDTASHRWLPMDIEQVGDRLYVTVNRRETQRNAPREGGYTQAFRLGYLTVPSSNWAGIGGLTNLGLADGVEFVGVTPVGLGLSLAGGIVVRPDGGYILLVLNIGTAQGYLKFYTADGTLETTAEVSGLGRMRVATVACGTDERFWLAVTGGVSASRQLDAYGWSGNSEESLPGVTWVECWREASGWSAVVRGDVSSEYLYLGLSRAGNDLLAMGIGPEGGQALARVAQFGFALENGGLLSAEAGDRTVNYREPRLWVDGEMRDASEVELDRDRGTAVMLRPFGDGFEIRADYDYLPTVDLVAVTEQERWRVLSDCLFAHGMSARVDEVGRFVFGPREVEEIWVQSGSSGSYRLGSMFAEGGIGGIVGESIEVMEATPFEDGLPQVSVVQVDVIAGGRGEARFELRMSSGGFAGNAVRIRYSVQESVAELGMAAWERGYSRESSRRVTKGVVRGSLRRPSELPQRMEDYLRIAPGIGRRSQSATSKYGDFARRQTLEMQFGRVLPASADVLEWRVREKVFERAVEDTPASSVQIRFDDPLLLGRARVIVFEGVLPLLASNLNNSWTANQRYRKFSIGGARDESYAVWVGPRETFRVCTADDFGDMTASNMVGGSGNLPASAAEVKTRTQCYVKRMNALNSASDMQAWEGMWVEYELDEFGRLVRSAAAGRRVRTAYDGKEILIRLRPETVDGVALLREYPADQAFVDRTANTQCAVTGFEVLPEGIRVGVESLAWQELRLGVEIVGYPVAQVAMVSAVSKDVSGVRIYGEQVTTVENDFVPNQERAERLSAGLVRWGTGRELSAAGPLSWFVRPGDVAWVTDSGGDRSLKRISEVVVSEGIGGSETRVVCR
ncbi:hypothetical protein KJZ99_00140 [bacterium]|nr:hypothetical protein [bacterium]